MTTANPTGTVYYLLTDHLGSTNVTVSSTGTVVGRLEYKPWGEIRFTIGTTPTDYRYTGQRSYTYINFQCLSELE